MSQLEAISREIFTQVRTTHRTEHALHGLGGVSPEVSGRAGDAGDDEYRLIYPKSKK